MLSVSDLPTRRNRRCASPQRASFSSVPPPQNCSFLPPPAAVTVLPPPGHARIPSVERHSAGTCSPTPEILRPDGLRMTGKQCHPEHQRRIPSVNRSASLIHGAGPSRLARVCGRSVFPPSRYAGVRALHALPPQFATGDTSLHTRLGAGSYSPAPSRTSSSGRCSCPTRNPSPPTPGAG